MAPTEYGRSIREHRLDLGWSQARLAREAGMTATEISNIETGRVQNPHELTRRALQRAFEYGERLRERWKVA